MLGLKFRKLKADEIDVKVGNVSANGYTLLLYKNARVDMAILDETVGAENWQNKFYEVCGNLYCSVGIKCGNEWIWKDDCGVESAFGDKEKGQASDARKRAGFAWGIGRELYTSPRIFISCEIIKEGNSYKIADSNEKYRKFKVSEITYKENGDIEFLEIVDNKGCIAFSNKTNKVEPVIKNDVKKDEQSVNVEELSLLCYHCGSQITEKVADYSLKKLGHELCFNCQKLPKEERDVYCDESLPF